MRRIGALLSLVARRATATPGLLMIRSVGMLVAVTLVAGVSLYSTAMGDAMLQARLKTDPSNTTIAVSLTGRPLTGSSYTTLDRYIRHQEGTDLALPLRNIYVHHTTSTVAVYRLSAHRTQARGVPTATLALDYYEGLASEIRMVSGRVDVPARLSDGNAPVLVSQYTARSLHLRLGDRLVYGYGANPLTTVAPLLVVTGIFAPRDGNSTFWGSNAGDTTYRALVAPRLATFQLFVTHNQPFSPAYFWTQGTELSAVHLADAHALLSRIDRVQSKVTSLAPGTSLITALGLNIDGFLYQYNLLPSILLILVVPILALILYAVAVTTALVLDRQAGEIVLMRSRGATRTQVFILYVCEGIALAVVAVLVGPLLGLPLARVIGRASGFLSFGGGLPFTVRLAPRIYLYAGVTALLCLVVGLLPAMGAARRSMTSFKGEQARPRGRPLWQRFFLDLITLIIALYGLWVLTRQGPVTSGAATAAVAQDPLIAIAPLLFAVAITLVISRFLPWLASLGLHALGRLSSPAAYVALQGVSRAPRQPMRLVQLCTLTLTLGIFAATVAGVEAHNLTDQQMYDTGATIRLSESFDRAHAPPRLHNEPDSMPLSAHLKLPGVHAATPALRYESVGNIMNTMDDGTIVNVLGIDPATAGRVMWFRPDFADQPFVQLLRSVAAPGPNAIVSDSFLGATGLHRGDTFDVTLTTNVRVLFRIAAVAHYFPTLNPREAPFVVTNLAYLAVCRREHVFSEESALGGRFEVKIRATDAILPSHSTINEVGKLLSDRLLARMSKSYGPNEVWLNTDRSPTAINRLLTVTHTWPRQISSSVGVTPAITEGGDPLTIGIYGVVSVGFLIAVALALLGLIVYAYLSLQQRLSEVAIVRALGLSQGQVRSLVLFEQVFLLGAAILGGIIAGLSTTQLFLPYLPIATNVMPPFLVVMPWDAIAEFVLALFIVFLLALSMHVSLLLRLQLGRVLRLGEG